MSLARPVRLCVLALAAINLMACQMQTTGTNSPERVTAYTTTTPALFADTVANICAANLPSFAKIRSALRARGFVAQGRFQGSEVFAKGNNQPVVALARGGRGTATCMVLALNAPNMPTATVQLLKSQHGFTQSGGFYQKGRIIGTTTFDRKPEGQVFGIVTLQLD